MSSGQSDSKIAVNRNLVLLAPRFREAVEQSIIDCRDKGIDAYVYEGYRSLELQQLYYRRGRSEIPPTVPVTNATTNVELARIRSGCRCHLSRLWLGQTELVQRRGGVLQKKRLQMGWGLEVEGPPSFSVGGLQAEPF